MLLQGSSIKKLKKSGFLAINPHLRKITWLFRIFEDHSHTQNLILHLLSLKLKGVRHFVPHAIWCIIHHVCIKTVFTFGQNSSRLSKKCTDKNSTTIVQNMFKSLTLIEGSNVSFWNSCSTVTYNRILAVIDWTTFFWKVNWTKITLKKSFEINWSNYFWVLVPP